MKFQLFNCRSQRRRFKQYNLFSFGAPLLGTVQYSTVQYSTVQHSTVNSVFKYYKGNLVY